MTKSATGTASRAPFGAMPDGRTVEAVTLTNAAGMSVVLIAYGAAIQSVVVPDRDGGRADVALGHATLAGYLETPQYFGATVGRVANRIAGGRFTLDGREYRVPPNDGDNALHGGAGGFDKALWRVIEVTGGAGPGVVMTHVSPDGDQGFPGTLTVTAVYSLGPDNALSVDYTATTDRPTVVALSNHAYWNLAREGSPASALDHRLTIPAEHYLPVDAGLIPTGEFRAVAGTPFDFRTPTPIGARVRDAGDAQLRHGRGYDHNWVVARDVADTPRLLARLADPGSGRMLEVWSTQPGVQFYSGNFLDGSTAGKSGGCYRQGDALAIEPQAFPDTVNRPAFGCVRLNPGETYRNSIVFRFSVDDGNGPAID